MLEAFPRGRFVWHELLTTEPDLAVQFYTKVMGWKVEAWNNDPSYRLWMSGKAPVGGLMRLPEEAKRMGARPHWMPYVAVPDVEETVRHAQSLGARLSVPPKDVPPGRFATLADPHGAAFSVFRPARSDDLGTDAPARGGFSWHELAAGDWRAAWAFYRALFGWEESEAMDMGPAGMYFIFKRAGTKVSMGGIYTKPSDMPGSPHWLCYVSVADADGRAAVTKKAGGLVVTGPMDVPGGGRIAMCVDPHGAAFAVHAQATPARARARRRAARKATPRPKAKRAGKGGKKRPAPRKRPARRSPRRRR